MIKRSYAKINLALDIVGKDESGYHLVQTVLQEIGLFDEIHFERMEAGVHITCSNPSIPTDQRNLIHKAVCEFGVEIEKLQGPTFDSGSDLPDAGRFGGLKVHIEKNIPVGAGLGGGSSNAAAAIMACNELWGLDLSDESLAKVAARVGMDVPFFIYGGTVLGMHYGEQLEVLPRSPDLDLVVVYPAKPSATKEMYELLDMEKCGLNIQKSRGLLAGLMRGDDNIIGYIGNDFESLIDDPKWVLGKIIKTIKEDLEDCGAQATSISGSGSAVFGVFQDDLTATKCVMSLEKKYPFCWHGKTVGA